MEDKVFSPATVIQTCSVVSEMTGDDALGRDFVEQEKSSIVDPQENGSSKWTNEKHSLYLKSIEASFVDQLYNSLDAISCQTQDTNCSVAISTCFSSGEYKVLRRGCWPKKKFTRLNSHMKVEDRPHVSPGNPWIQHFRNRSRKRRSLTVTSLHGWSNNPYQPVIVAEVVDQNFAEDTSCSKKRVITSEIDHASNDQVVPHCTCATTTEIPGSYVSTKE